MRTRATDPSTENGGLGGAAKNVADHTSNLINLVKELATLELKEKVATLGGGVGLTAGGALAGGFVLAGGIGATMRLVARRGREGRRKATLGRFSLVDRG